jgi:hypothetical protein
VTDAPGLHPFKSSSIEIVFAPFEALGVPGDFAGDAVSILFSDLISGS